MHVAVDARSIYALKRRGTGKNLIDLYSTLASLKRDWTFTMFFQQGGASDPFAGLPNVSHRQIDIPGDRFNLWEEVRLPMAARAAGAHVLHSPANTAPALPLVPLVVTIHDLIPLEIDPDSSTTRSWKSRVQRAAIKARRIITPSEYTRTRLVSQLRVPATKISVNPWAPDRQIRRIESTDALVAIRQKYGIGRDRPYVFAFGAEDPRKNTARLIEAWSRLDPSVRERARLVIVGLQPAALERYRRVRDELNIADSCVLYGFADEEDIAGLLTDALALCYPSRSEGFGLPVLDAFACGTPVITSTTTSLPEVAGEGALLVEPEDSGAIVAALTEMLTSPATRERLRHAGSERVRQYSWERCAEHVAHVLESAAA